MDRERDRDQDATELVMFVVCDRSGTHDTSRSRYHLVHIWCLSILHFYFRIVKIIQRS